MTDRPTPPEQPGDPHEATTRPGTPEPTAPLSPGRPAARPSTPRRWWSEATATTGSTIALVTAGVLALVLLLAGVGLVGSWVAHRVDLVGLAADDDGRRGGPMGWGRDDDRPRDTPHGNHGRGNGGDDRGGLDPGAVPGLGAVLHGEFTTSITGSPTVMVFQSGEVSAYTEDESLEVTSSDGFEATYVIDSSTALRGTPADGAQVRVVAAKDGMTAVLVAVTG